VHPGAVAAVVDMDHLAGGVGADRMGAAVAASPSRGGAWALGWTRA